MYNKTARFSGQFCFAYHKKGKKNKCLYLFSEPTQWQAMLITSPILQTKEETFLLLWVEEELFLFRAEAFLEVFLVQAVHISRQKRGIPPDKYSNAGTIVYFRISRLFVKIYLSRSRIAKVSIHNKPMVAAILWNKPGHKLNNVPSISIKTASVMITIPTTRVHQLKFCHFGCS